jgi:hypothetical protein
MGLRVLVCGDRYWSDRAAIHQVLKDLPEGSVVIQGECRGVDLTAKSVAQALGFEVECYPADWDKYGKAAGPIRNKQMLEEGKPDIVVAFHDDIDRSRGTKNMLKQAEEAGIPTEVKNSLGVQLRKGEV